MLQASEYEDRRRQPRRRTLKSAQVMIDRKAPPLECIVRNLSDQGALLLLSSLAVTDRFDLVLESDRTRHHCRVVWRALDRVGVEFEN
jgi:hypothetical protein